MPARRKINRGQEQIQREWYGPHYRPPAPKRLHQAGDLVDQVLKKFGLEDASRLEEVRKIWPVVAGPANAAHSCPGKLERNTLTVYVNHHLWLNEMKRVASKSILKRLQDQFGKTRIRSLRFEITPEEEG